jgi:hypothetical protein
MTVTAAAFCLIVALLAGGLFLLELAVRLLPWVLAAAGWALEVVLWLAWAGIAATRAVRRRASPWAALRAAA